MNVEKTPSSPTQPFIPPKKILPPDTQGKAPLRDTAELTDIYKSVNPNGMLPIILTSVPEERKEDVRKLLAEKLKCRNISDLPLVDGLSVEIRPEKLKKLVRALPVDIGISIDRKIEYPNPVGLYPNLPPTDPYKGPNETEAKNVYIESLGFDKIWQKGYTGKGIGVCVIDSGIYSHEDFEGRIIGWKDMTPDGKGTNFDPFGHGTHVSGIIGGSGKASEGKIKGVAPDVNLVGVRITSVSEAIKALQWAIDNKDKYGLRVINMSLGDYAVKSYKDDPWAQAAEKAVAAGLVVVVAGGNEGPGPRSISTPGIDPRVITVGSLDDKKTVETEDDKLANNSSRGPTSVDNLDKPDTLAFGVNIYAPLSPKSKLDIPEIPHFANKYISFSGTSMATPMVTGLCALLLQANPNLTHDQIKSIILSTADQVPELDKYAQGKGRIDPVEALDKALATSKSDGGKTEQVSKLQAPPRDAGEEWIIS